MERNLVEIELEYLNVFSMYLFIEKLLSSSRGVIEFQEMIFQLVYHGSAVTQHPPAQQRQHWEKSHTESKFMVQWRRQKKKSAENCGCHIC